MNGVKIILINPAGEILLLHREDKPDIEMPNTWSFVGGGIDDGETPEEAIVRETKEEIGYDVKEATLFKVYKDSIERHVFVAKIDKPISELNLMEGDDFGFFKVEDALKMDISKNTRKFIGEYFNQKD